MADRTGIEWTDATWNPTTGCDQVSPGCDHCYALTLAKRLKSMGSAKYQRDGDQRTSGPGFGVTEHADSLVTPLGWRAPRRVFVNSMSDLFHSGVSDGFITQVWEIMARTPRHTYQILTKRHGRMRSLLNQPTFRDRLAPWSTVWPLPNVWLGVSVEDQTRAELRIPSLLATPAAVRWLSCEPLLGPVDLTSWLKHVQTPACDSCDPGGPLDWHSGHLWGRCRCACHPAPPARPDWVVVGGESGPDARRMDPAWVRSLRDQCAAAGVAFHMKQTGVVLAKEWGATSKGGDPGEWPETFPREYPHERSLAGPALLSAIAAGEEAP